MTLTSLLPAKTGAISVGSLCIALASAPFLLRPVLELLDTTVFVAEFVTASTSNGCSDSSDGKRSFGDHFSEFHTYFLYYGLCHPDLFPAA
jgi:hypothetical protein